MTDSTTNLKSLESSLQASPIFHMSLGSKELFHSNFLAWLTEAYPDKMSVLFAELLDSSSNTLGDLDNVEREKRSIDLAITFADVRLVIENKVKSVPYPEQLDKYKDREEKYSKNKTFENIYILLTLNKPTFGLCDGWKLITYKALADKLKDLKVADSYHQALLNDYVQYIQCLNKIMKLFRFDVSSQEQQFLLNKGDSDILKELRLFDMVTKYRAAQVEQELRQVFRALDISFDTKLANRSKKSPLCISHGFSRQGAFVDFHCLHSCEPKATLGIVVQDNRLCWGVEMATENECEKLYSKLVLDSSASWTKDSLGIPIEYESVNLRKNKKYRKFGGFLYDYVIIPDNATLEDIVKVIQTGIESAIELRKVVK